MFAVGAQADDLTLTLTLSRCGYIGLFAPATNPVLVSTIWRFSSLFKPHEQPTKVMRVRMVFTDIGHDLCGIEVEFEGDRKIAIPTADRAQSARQGRLVSEG